MKRTIEVEDNLQETVENCKEELFDDFIEFIIDNPDIADFDMYYQQSGADRMNEIVDSNTPIYYSEIDGLYYLYGNKFDEAYSNAGIGDGSEDNHRQVAIYCYLEQETSNFMNDIQDWFDNSEFKDKLNQLHEEEKEEEIKSMVNELTIDNFIDEL